MSAVCNTIPLAVGTVGDRDNGAFRQAVVNRIIRTGTGAEIDVIAGNLGVFRKNRNGQQDTEQRSECQSSEDILSHLSVRFLF